MNKRVEQLRNHSLHTAPSLSMERAQLVTEAYQKHAGTESAPVLRALVFKHVMERKTICIHDGELIIGERGPSAQQSPTYPELCCHTLEDMGIIHRREKVSFAVSEESKQIQAETIIPYWKGRSVRDRIFAKMTKSWKQCYEAGIFTEFMEQRAPGHTVADDKLYRKGLYGLQQEIEQSLGSLDYLNDPAAYQKREELEAMLICIEGMVTFARRHAEAAEELACRERDPDRRRELEMMAEVSRRVPAHAPRNTWEALQAYWYIHLGVITELNTWDAFNPGRLDQHLYPFYQKDTAEGTFSQEEIRELLQCFWIKFNNQPAPPKVGVTMEESGTYTDFANINIGGLKPDGTSGVNEVSHLLLDVVDEMRLLQPSSNIQVSEHTPDAFIEHACQVIRKGWGQPSVFNADAVVEELLRQGKTLVDARCGGTSGCVETGAFGKESYILTGYFNLPKILEITLHNGVDPRTGHQLGIPTGEPEGFTSFDALFEAFRQQLEHFIEIKVQGNNVIEQIYAVHMPSPFLSILVSDCIAKGQDYNAGGARYNTTYIQGVGIGSLTDCLAAIRYHVFDQQTLSMAGLLDALAANFQGHERTRQLLLNKTPRYGNDDDYADSLMTRAFEAYRHAVEGRINTKGGVYRINMLPTTCHVYFGSVIGATPDGRLAKETLSEGISPVQGKDRHGPSAVIRSAGKMDHRKTGGTLLNQKFSPRVVAGEEGLHRLGWLIRSYFQMHGHHIQFNVISKETLLEAQAHPEKHEGLIVRVAGYSDYFSHLNEGLQNEIIHRTEHESF